MWNNPKLAEEIMREKTRLENKLNNYKKIISELADSQELLEMAEAENDDANIKEAEQALLKLEKHAKKFEIESMFAGEADGNNCFLEIHSGAGGTESCDWAFMMLRMYLRWAEKNGFKAELVDEQSGDEAGIKSATLRIEGINAYGWLKSESGVHRLVRISPFDSNARRHTSFASAWVYPEVDDNIDIKIEDKDLKVDTYRASGAGGQHVNKTESAIRITHIPSGVVAACQNSRSQHKNRAEAMKMLKSRLYEIELRKKEQAMQAMNDSKTDNGWGNQIRSYVLQPYQMIKDLRTGFETSDTSGVLDGDLEGFMVSFLVGEER